MSIQHLTDAQSIVRTATRLGVTLPEQVTQAMTHLESILAARTTPSRPGALAKELAQHLGNPAAMEKATKAAALHLATSESRAKLDAMLVETCGSKLRGIIGSHTEEVSAAFGEVLAPDLAALQESAACLPQWFREDQAGSLSPEIFRAWTQARDAYTRIQAAQAALSPLYSGAIGQANADQFARGAANALRFAEPPEFATPRDAYAFRDALAGRTERIQGLAGQGSTFVDGLFVPTVLAHLGARFVWATPAEVAARSMRVVDAMRELVASP